MEVEHLIGLGVMVVLALLAAWLVWTCLCKGNDDDGEDVESQQGEDEEVKSVNSRTKVISRQYPGENNQHERNNGKSERDAQFTNPREVFIKPKTKNKASCYVQSSKGLADPFGEWTRKEKVIDDTEALSGIKVYRKSPVLPHRS
ncbi:unnamed protein product [Orchesella dallaii]|uniref:Uncharacterized protein n=1 Tax=Orchesella dallaii TaxID=48710 RepID=A0ABP1PSM8_9HEXA